MTAEKNPTKTVLITGGARGIGFDTAKMLLEKTDYRIGLLGQDEARLEQAEKALSHFSTRVNTFRCDLRDPQALEETAHRIQATFRSIYGLVNNAGIYPFGDLNSTTLEQWDETHQINVKAPFLLAQHFAPYMNRNQEGGRIVNIASTAGLLPNHFALAYSVSKAALIQLTRTLAKELGENHITVNCICPGIVQSPMHEAYHHSQSELEQFYAKRGAAYPLGRVGTPEDIAGAIKFFLSEEAQWITGDVLVADGGRLLT